MVQYTNLLYAFSRNFNSFGALKRATKGWCTNNFLITPRSYLYVLYYISFFSLAFLLSTCLLLRKMCCSKVHEQFVCEISFSFNLFSDRHFIIFITFCFLEMQHGFLCNPPSAWNWAKIEKFKLNLNSIQLPLLPMLELGSRADTHKAKPSYVRT